MPKIINELDTLIANSRKELNLYVSRNIMYHFKSFITNKSNKHSFQQVGIINHNHDVNFIITFEKVEYDFAFDVYGAFDWDDCMGPVIELVISANKNNFPLSFSDLDAEIKDTIEHESIHMYQDLIPEVNDTLHYLKQKDVIESKELIENNESGFLRYFLNYRELMAFTHGFIKHAKSKRISIHEVIDNYLELKKDLFTNSEEINKTKNKFIEFVKIYMPKYNIK